MTVVMWFLSAEEPSAARHVPVGRPSSQPSHLHHHWNMDRVSKPNITHQGTEGWGGSGKVQKVPKS